MVMGQQLDLDVVTPTKYSVGFTHNGVDGTLFTDGKLFFDGDAIDAEDGTLEFDCAIALGNNKITGLATPAASTDGATKGYVDTLVASVLDYKGTYDANANTYYPSSPGVGDIYIISVGGTLDLPGGGNEITFDAGDWMLFNGSTWDKIDNSDLVTSVDGQTGAVSVVSDVAYNESTWNAVTAIAASKNAIRDKIDAMDTLIAANTTQTEVEAIIDAEIVGGQSIDNAIDALINAHNVADNHVGHAGVSIIAGTGLTGGGTIEATRTINCSITQYTDALARTACLEDTAYGAGWDNDTSHAPTQNAVYDKISSMDTLIAANTTQAEVESIITAELVNGQSIDNAIDALISNHNVADNHISHAGVSITAGTGLTGGGTIAATRTINCSITQYTDAMAEAVSINNVVEDTTPQLGGDLDLNQKSIELDEAPNANLTGNGLIISDQLDENPYEVGGLMHIQSDGDWVKAHCDAEANMPCEAMAMESGTGVKKLLLHGFFRNDTWNWTPGAVLYVSSVGNATATRPTTSGHCVQVIGFAIHADMIYFNPSPDYIKLV